MNRVIHFEIPATNPEKAINFYKNVFGWTFNNIVPGEYWMADTGTDVPGINGAVMKRKDPGQPVTNNIQVENIEAAFALIQKHGGRIVVEKTEAAGMGWYAYFTDTDGNIFGIWQTK